MLGFGTPKDESTTPPEGLEVPADQVTWPNQTAIVDGVVPVDEVSQEEDFLNDEEDDLDLEMED